MTDEGHDVTGVGVNPIDASFARKLALIPRKGKFTFIEDDFYHVKFTEWFDVILCWQVFGLGSDDDQRLLLQKMQEEWLKDGGVVLWMFTIPMVPFLMMGRSGI